jgi:7-keto-8-aminopelargonate synthetase-like enzyme/acyl-CoA synthetase (AMP-forming)/AMP-acid ligase II/acyl carrier protein
MSRPLRPPDRISNFADVLRWWTERESDREILSFLLDGEDDEIVWTYADLDLRARSIAAQLQALGARGERVLLTYPPGLDFAAGFFGCLYAGSVAVPAYPPQSARALPRLQAMAFDAEARFGLTSPLVHAALESQAGDLPLLKEMRWLAIEDDPGDAASSWREPVRRDDDIAFLQYTSGSTGDPKGVMVGHANLMANSVWIRQMLTGKAETRGVMWLPPYHDMGLITGILHPIYGSIQTQLMSPVAFLQKPFRWLRAISRFRATASGGPSFSLALCVRKITPEQRETLDLSCWETIINGGEPVSAAVEDAFAETFAPCGFRRGTLRASYGMAENTLVVTSGPIGSPPQHRDLDTAALERDRVVPATEAAPARRLVGNGPTFPGQEIRIVDPETAAPCPPGRIGEIWISGPSVAQGYWNRPEETDRIFRARIAGDGEAPFLRTGDLGFLEEGELFISGRLKDLIIIRGRNHYPHDIERTAERSHPTLRPGCSAAFSLEEDGEERLVVVSEIAREAVADLDAADVMRAVRRSVSEQHDLQVHAVALLEPRGLPKTASGKIRRGPCRASFLEGTLPCIARHTLADAEPASPPPAARPASTALSAVPPAERRDFLESYLSRQLAAALNVPVGQVDPSASLSTMGLDSLAIVELAGVVEEELEVFFPVEDGLHEQSIEQISERLCAVAAQHQPGLAAAAPSEDAEDLFAKCRGDGGYFGEFRVQQEDYFTRPVLEGSAGPRMRFRGREVIVWSINNYLGIAGRPEIRAAASKALEEYGTWSPMGSRMMTGNTERHVELERRLAGFCAKPASVLFNYGYLGVLGTISSLVRGRDTIVIDKQSHACIVDAASMVSGRRPFRVFEHNDPNSLEAQLRGANRDRRGGLMVVTEGVFGMSGELAPLPEICELTERYDARLFVDDAHGFGVMGENGRGAGEHFGVQDRIDLYFGTFAKAFAAIGGVTAAEDEVVEYIRYNARPNIFAKSLPLIYVEVVLAALDLIEGRPELRDEMWRVTRRLQTGLTELGFELGSTRSPITPVYVPADDPETAMAMIRMLREEHNVFVSGVTYPVVPRGIVLFRLMPTAAHTDEDVDRTLEAFGALEERFGR